MSNIIYTTGNDRNKLAELYKLWKGNDLRKDNGITINDHYIVAVDIDTGDYVGAATLITNHDSVHKRDWGLVENVFVHPDYRRQGIGENLMDKIELQAFGLGMDFIKLTSRKPEAQALYKKLGYTEGKSFYREIDKS